jgi:hypothetical protein
MESRYISGALVGFAFIAGASVALDASAQEQPPVDAGAPDALGGVGPSESTTGTPEPQPPQGAPPKAPAPAYPPPQANAQPAPAYPYQQWQGYPPEERRRQWYGWQTLISDGASIFLLATAAGIANDASNEETAESLVYGGLAGYYLGAPIIHWAHGHVGKGFASLGIRAGGTVLMLFAISSCFDGPCDSGAGVLAFVGVAAMIAAIPIDAAVLAREDAPMQPASLRQRRLLTDIRLAPLVDAERRSGGLSLMGNF